MATAISYVVRLGSPGPSGAGITAAQYANLVDNPTFTGGIISGDADSDGSVMRGHLRHRSAAPTVANGAAIGTGGSVGTSISGTDQFGEVTITAGTSSLAVGVAATITFNQARPNTNYTIHLDAKGDPAGTNLVQRRVNNLSTTAWEVRFVVAPVSGVQYRYTYAIMEWSN